MTDLHPDDLSLLGMEAADVSDDGRSGAFTIGPGLTRHDGALYGGTGLAVSVLAMGAAAGRDVLWATTQFVSSPRLGARIEWTTEVLAQGRRAWQLLVRAGVGGEVAFTAVGTAGRSSEDGLTGQYRKAPDVGPPGGSAPWGPPGGAPREDGWGALIEMREAALSDPAPNQSAMWVRRRDGRPLTPVAIGFAADFVPVGVARSAGRMGAGASLDNSMRFRPGSTTEWALLELLGDFAAGGYGHGTVRVWSESFELVAVGSQTASMKYLWQEGEAPRLPTPR